MPGVVIHELKQVYWPVPKTCMSMLKAVIANRQGVEFDIHEGGDLEMTDASIPGYHDWAIVRHPASRLWGVWYEKIREGISYRNVGGLDLNIFGRHLDRFRVGMSFEEFFDAVRTIPEPEADEHYAPQDRQVPAWATWVRYEDVRPLLLLAFPQINATGSQDRWKEGTEARYAEIREHYARDFERFGYE